MRRVTVAVPSVILGILLIQFIAASAGGRTRERQQIIAKPVSKDHSFQTSSFAAADVDTIVMAEYTFDDGIGGPDAQGWITVDLSSHVDSLFHVDDFSGMGGSNTPLQGSRSLWCGATTDPAGCISGSTYPGYGHNWEQYFESVPFATTGDVTIDFQVRYDTESNYDYLYVEYLAQSDEWHILNSYHGQGDHLVSLVVPADSLDGTAKLRFRFTSDGIGSDEDGVYDSQGAVVIDSLTISDGSGLVDFQDFESEQPGDLQTSDGDWTANRAAPFGDHSALLDGSGVLQEDSLVTNTTYLWGFFNGSTYFGCDGNPGQPVVPYTRDLISNDPSDYIYNQVWSPELSIDADSLLARGARLLVELDVYGDMALDALVFYTVWARYLVDGCWTPWRETTVFYHREAKTWQRHFEEIDIEPGATKVQVSFGVQDLCWSWCGVIGSGACHSHGPLIDNVRIGATATPLVVTNTNDAPEEPSQWALHQNVPNPFNPVTTISYDVPASGGHVSLAVYDVSGRLVRTLVAERQSAGNKQVTWNGRNDRGQPVATGVYFYRLTAGGFTQTRKMLLVK